MATPNDAGDYWNPSLNPWNTLPLNPWSLDDFAAIHQLEARFNHLNLSHQSRPRPESSTPLNDSLYHGYTGGGFRQQQHIGSVTPPTPMGGGGGGGGGNPGISYQGSTFYPTNHDNLVSRMIGEGSGGRRHMNMNMNMMRPYDNLNRLSLYHLLNNSTPSNWARFCIQQQFNNNNRSNSSSTMLLPDGNNNNNNVYLMAKTQYGRRNLQKIFDEGVPEKINMIFCQVKDHVHELMKHQSGNIMIQKMFEVCNAHQITELVRSLLRDDRHLLDVCIDNHGTRAMQKLLGYLGSQDQRHLILSCLRRITLHLTKDANGHHVIERCFDLFPRQDTLQILNVVAAHCVDIAANKSGCCLLQHCILNEEVIDPLNRIVAEITANALSLSVDQYGNYVVQYIVGLKMDNATREIVSQLSGNFVSLSLDKYGSHVVEKCINFCPEDQIMKIIEEIITNQDFLAMLQDPYGNFVAQSAFRVSKGSIRAMMLDLIKKNHPFLHSHPHGKRVLDKIGFHQHGKRLDAN